VKGSWKKFVIKVIEMNITRIVVKDKDDNILHSDYWKGPRMTDIMRQELREILRYSSNPVIDTFYTMSGFGYNRIDPDIEQFEVRR
jgi:hypothetical protein